MTAPSHWAGQARWDEVWFLELHHDDGRCSWIRYVLRRDERGCTLTLWFLMLEGQTWITRQATAQADAAPECAIGALRYNHAFGAIDDVEWDLTLGRGRLPHDHVPPALRALGLGRTYRSECPDLHAVGTIRIGDTRQSVRARGVAGHIWGARNRAQAWAWGHAVGVEGAPDLVWEGLSAVLAHPRAPPLTSVMVDEPGRRAAFSSLRSLFTTASAFPGSAPAAGRWIFTARGRAGVLTGEAVLGEHSVLVRYADDQGQPIWCRNSPRSTVQLTLTTPGGPTQRWVTHEACFELATRVDPGETTSVGP